MDFSVKTIFKTLIGTMFMLVVASLLIEMFNMTTTALQLNQITKIAARQSAVLFSQETYKERDEGGSKSGATRIKDVVNESGSIYVSGDFYGNTDAKTIYKNLYGTSSPFYKDWVPNIAAKGPKGHYWKSIELLHTGLGMSGDPVAPTDVTASNFDTLMAQFTEKTIAKSYVDVMMTPLNLGIPYLDKTTVNKMFQWNLAQIASDCHKEVIRKDPLDSSKYCIYYKGFRIYADQAEITELEYEVYEVDKGEAGKLEKMTGIQASELGITGYDAEALGGYDNYDERNNICVVGIKFSVPIGYDGITPIKNIFAWVNSQSVQGMKDTAPSPSNTTWNDATATLQSGGFSGNAETDAAKGILPVPGRLVYYIVR